MNSTSWNLKTVVYLYNQKIFPIYFKKLSKNQGFFGDGFVCATKTCDILNNCHENAKCIPDSMTLQFRCVCLNGYIGNGYDCVKDGELLLYYHLN